MIPTRHLLLLAVLEGLVIFSAVIRLAIPGLGIDFSQPPQLAWFIAVVLIAGGAVAQYVIRASVLMPRIRAGDPVEGELKQVLGVSIAMVGLAALVSVAGPSLFQRLAG